ncbi:hypothetical protein FBU30_007601 [Linnemannia zychae]|nr:hypothetical protein FBU30_007601 [Linnemannia zychae]
MESKFSGGNIPLAISLSPNGKNFSSAYLDGKIRVFNIQATEISETDISLTECKSSLIKSIAYSPDGSKIVLGHENGRLRLWEFNTSNLIHWKGHDEAINMVAFSPNGHWIASCSKDKTIKLWDAHKGEFAFSLAGHVRSTSAIVFSPNSLVLATGSSDKTVRLWDLTANRTEYIKNRKSEAENSIFSIDGRHVITANRSGIVRQFNTLTGELEKSITFGNTKSKLVVISPDGLLIATTEKSNRSVYMWSTESGQKKFGPFKHPEIVKAVAFSPQDFMVAISSNKLIYLWNIKSGNLFGVCGLGDRLGCATSLQFSSNGQQLVISGNNALIFVLEINTGIIKEIPAKECTDDVIAAVGFSPRSLRITASNISKCNFSIWNQLDSTFQNTLKCKVPIYKFAWSYCEQWIATGSGTSVSLWNMPPDRLKEWTCATIIRDFHREIRSIDWKRNSLEFVTGCEDGSVRVWRLVETLNIWTVQLVWSAGNEVFVASRVSFSGAVDLSTTNRRLLEQRSESKDVSFFRI